MELYDKMTAMFARNDSKIVTFFLFFFFFWSHRIAHCLSSEGYDRVADFESLIFRAFSDSE
jgi:serine acetyltransferase